MNQAAALKLPLRRPPLEAARWSFDQIRRGAAQMIRASGAKALASPPSHVPPELIVDFDFIRQPGLVDDVHLTWKKLQEEGPAIFWTPRNGGYWMPTRADDIIEILRDPENFSSREIAVPRGSTSYKMLPIEADPPEHGLYRSLINPWFTPKAVNAMEGDIRALAVELMEGFLGAGECEFVNDFAKRLPILIFLKLVDLPLDDREKLLEWTEGAVRATSMWQRMKSFLAFYGYLDGWVRERRARPSDDLISRVVHTTFDGRPLSHGEIHGLLIVLMFGGLDTVAAMLSYSTWFLATHPDHRRQLIDNPEIIPRAVDELMRRHGLVNNGRIVTRDLVFRGVQFKEGDQIQIPTALFGLDEDKFVDPLKVDFDRSKGAHAAFGSGPHQCPGAYLARMEIRIFLEEWLKRIPDFSVKPGEKPLCSPGSVNAMEYLPLVWRCV